MIKKCWWITSSCTKISKCGMLWTQLQQVMDVFYILKNCVANPNNIIIINIIWQSQGVLGRHSIKSL
jgi:hypothetical protein